MRASALALFVLVPGLAAADKVDDYIRSQMKEFHIAGMSIAVLVKDNVVKLKGYGSANLELNVPSSPQTVYEIGSITKQFTSMSIMMLVEQGKVGLEDKISKYVPGSPDTWKDVTIRELLTHTSGIANYTGINGFQGVMTTYRSKDDIVKYFAKEPLDFIPGSKWNYSNSGYFLLGLVVEKASGEPYERFVQENIFTPLGMSSTRLNNTSEIIKNRASGYSWAGKGFVNINQISMSWPYSAGALISTAEDFTKWAVALDNQKLLKPESYRQIFSPVKLNDGTYYDYGFGWEVAPYRGHALINHGGGIPGFLTDIDRWTKDGVTVVVFTNSDSIDPHRVALGLSSFYIRGVKPPFLMQPKADPNASAARILMFMKNLGEKKQDELLGPALEKTLDETRRKRLASFAARIKTLTYLDSDTLALSPNVNGEPATKASYYRVDAGPLKGNLTVFYNKEGKILDVSFEM